MQRTTLRLAFAVLPGCPFRSSGLLGRDSSDLEHYAKEVDLRPELRHLPAFNPVDVDLRPSDLVSRRGYSVELPLVGGAGRRALNDLVVFCHQVLDRRLNVREPFDDDSSESLHPLPSPRQPRVLEVMLEPGGEELVNDSVVRLVLELLNEAFDEALVLVGCGSHGRMVRVDNI